jgi:hypothetical protein
MEARDFTRLAVVGVCSEGDTRTRATTLWPDSETTVSARAVGSYAAAGATVAGQLASRVTVSSTRLIGASRIFAHSDEVSLRVGKGLTITDGKTRHILPLLPDPDVEVKVPSPVVMVDMSALRREVREVGSAASTLMTAPILTGIRLIGHGDSRFLGVEANNGYSLHLRSAIEADASAELDVVVPVAEIRRALTILSGTRVGLGRIGNRFCLSGHDGYVLIAMMGDGSLWPKPRFPGPSSFAQQVTLPAEVLGEVVKASAIHPGAAVILRPEWGEVVIETEEQGDGHYERTLAGALVSPAALGPAEVAVLARTAQEEEVALYVDGTSALAVLGKTRRAMMMMRYTP